MAKVYLCNQQGTVFPFLSRLACWILSLTNKHGITLIPAYIPTHSMWRLIICPRIGCFQSGTFFLRWLKQLFIFGAFQRGSAGIFSFHSMPALLHLRISTTCGALGLNAFNHPWTFQVGYLFPPPALVPLVLSKFLAEHVKSQLRQLILVTPCWMEVPWLPTVLNILVDIPQQCPVIKDLIMNVSVDQTLKGLPYLHLTIWLHSDVCYVDRGFSSSVHEAVEGAT